MTRSTLTNRASPWLQALVSCLELLEHDSVDTRVCACKALACLRVGSTVASVACGRPVRSVFTRAFPFGFSQAKESIDQLVYVCRTDKEDVREAAKQTLLVLGELLIPNSLFCPLACVGATPPLTRVLAVEQARRARWPTDTWRRPKTRSPGSSQRRAWRAPPSSASFPPSHPPSANAAR